jgi:hypothetical protein
MGPPSDLARMSGVTLTCDLVASTRRQVELTAYMDRHVLGPAGFCCSSATRCRTSAMAQKEPADFADGQLSHLGKFYDIEADGVPLRILIIAMETGRTDTGVTLPKRRQQILESAAETPRDRNQHMVGVTHALRTLHGRRIGDDSIGELLDFGNSHDRVHMFDAYAMANIRLCTSVKAGTTNSYPTAVMARNCVRHLKETLRILQPTVCVVQSMDIPKALAPIVTHRRAVAPHLAEVEISGVQTLMAEFSHPKAWGELNWGRWTNMPYLQSTVIPTLKEARALLGLPTDPDSSSVGVETEVVRVTRSVPAPDFKLVAQPNDYQKQAKAATTAGPTTEQSQPYWDFWLQFRGRVATEHPDWKARAGTSRTSPNATLPAGTPRTIFCSAFKPGPLRLELAFVDRDPAVNLARFEALQAKKDQFERALGASLLWDEMAGKNDTRVYIVSPFDSVDDRDQWPATMDWLIEQHVRFKRAIQVIGGLDGGPTIHRY